MALECHPAGLPADISGRLGDLPLAVHPWAHELGFVYARSFLSIPTDWNFAIGATGLIHDAWNIRLLPHYALGVFFVLSHLASGLRMVLIAHGVDRLAANRLLGCGRRNKRPYLGGDHRGYVRGSDQLGDGGGRRGRTRAVISLSSRWRAIGNLVVATHFTLDLQLLGSSGSRHVEVR
jgi:hypothetical protein